MTRLVFAIGITVLLMPAVAAAGPYVCDLSMYPGLMPATQGGGAEFSLVESGDGSLGSPGFGFSSDAGNGMYLSGADTLAFQTNSLLRLSISNTYITLARDTLLNTGKRLYFWDAGGGEYMYAPQDGQVYMIAGGALTQVHYSLGMIIPDDIRTVYGSGNDYWFEYVAGNTGLYLKSSDIDGAGTDGNVLVVRDGAQGVLVGGGIRPGTEAADPCAVMDPGSLFYNTVGDYICYCDSGGVDLKLDNTTACF